MGRLQPWTMLLAVAALGLASLTSAGGCRRRPPCTALIPATGLRNRLRRILTGPLRPVGLLYGGGAARSRCRPIKRTRLRVLCHLARRTLSTAIGGRKS